ncbi:flippase [Methanococcus aeolicus]|uniref:Polysaccharide biosynthesis protein n=1 Tax=Methanococcus aeolicus (strain ATCC BAA-1280 / DSM 17508 / OCM 812 / Nankai-3) TaxID=419665 RepID=A6UTE2_META3|nr:flippase [Methanococcus aeolicus]ABR55764.1 polysaccharide biosynthesis protein [Methanococcus aeolicus Nankai-3]UXM84131.1 flippase [Methanococcus aeolicus]
MSFNLKNLKKDGLLKDSIFMIFSNIYSKGMGYLFYFLTALILGTEGFGTLRGLLPLMDIITIFFCSGIPPSIAKHLSENENSNNEWIISILKIMILFSILGAPIIILLKYILGGGYSTIDISIYIAVVLAVICSSFISWNRGVLQGSLKIKELSLTWIIENTSKIIFLIIFALLFGVMGAFLSISFAYLIGGIFGYYLLLKYIKIDNINIKNINLFKWDNKHNKKVKQVLYYAIPIALGTASYRLLNDIDSIAIMSLLGAYDNGIYGYASLLSRAVFLFASAISIPLIPRIAKTKDINYLKKGLLLNFFIVIPVLAVVFIFAGELLKLFFGIVNNDAVNCLKILSISAGFMSSYTVCSSSLQGLGRAKIPLYILIVGILLNIILNYTLIPKIGIIGGAYATLISSMSIFLIILAYIYYGVFGSSQKKKILNLK